jgi:spermidine synthase
VKEIYPEDPVWHGYDMVHGITIHGLQFTQPDKRQLPTAYFSEVSGIGTMLLNHPKYGHGMRVGVIGLGVGTLAAYGQPGDMYRFYEINPIVVDLAQGKGGYFSFLKDSKAQVTTVLGDGRISLERELAQNGSDQLDLLVIDAFSSDSIPVHLLTKEAFDIYLKHLVPNGIVAANISNRNIDLRPVLWQQAKYYHMQMVVVTTEGDGKRIFTAKWALLSRSPDAFENPAIASKATFMDGYSTTIPQWTDDFSNLFQILQ